MTAGKERRRHERFELEARAEVRRKSWLARLGLGRGNVAVGPVDLSEGGVRLLTTRPLEPGTKVKVHLRVEKFNDELESVAEVRWCRPHPGEPKRYCVGLAFADLVPEEYRMIGFLRGYFTSNAYRTQKETRRRQAR